MYTGLIFFLFKNIFAVASATPASERRPEQAFTKKKKSPLALQISDSVHNVQRKLQLIRSFAEEPPERLGVSGISRKPRIGQSGNRYTPQTPPTRGAQEKKDIKYLQGFLTPLFDF